MLLQTGRGAGRPITTTKEIDNHQSQLRTKGMMDMTTGHWSAAIDQKPAAAEQKQDAASATSICVCPKTKSVLKFTIINKNAHTIL